MSDIGWLLYNLTGLCTEAGCGMSHWLHISLVCCSADPYIGGEATWSPPESIPAGLWSFPLGPHWRTPSLSSGPRPNLFQREVMKELIISNEELVIGARRNDCQHHIEESKKVSQSGKCQTVFFRDLQIFLIRFERQTAGFSGWAEEAKWLNISVVLTLDFFDVFELGREWILLGDNPVVTHRPKSREQSNIENY